MLHDGKEICAVLVFIEVVGRSRKRIRLSCGPGCSPFRHYSDRHEIQSYLVMNACNRIQFI